MHKHLAATLLAFSSCSAFAEAYVVDGFDDVPQIVNENVTEKFRKTFPPSEWKIVPIGRIFRMGNGSLQGATGVAVAPRSAPRTEFSGFMDYRRQHKRSFEATINGAQIKKLNKPEFEAEMFDDANFRRAGGMLLSMMYRESMQKMMAQCESTPDCSVGPPNAP